MPGRCFPRIANRLRADQQKSWQDDAECGKTSGNLPSPDGIVAMKPFTIRLAEPSDSLAIAEIQIATWRSAYRGIVPEKFLSSMSVVSQERLWSSHVSRPHSPLFVAVRDAECIGFCHVSPARDPDAVSHAEIVALYVSPHCQKQGAGRLLMSRAIDFATSNGYESLCLWVLSLNHSGRSFYEQAGFTTDGHRRQILISGVFLDEVRYSRCTKSAPANARRGG